MPNTLDDATFDLVDRALTANATLPGLPASLASRYAAHLDRLYRWPNRISISIFTIVFDLFLFSQAKSSPELVPISAILRLAIYTPAVALFLLLDSGERAMARRPYDISVLALAIAPAFISAFICVHTTSTHSLSDVHATTLILLSVGLILRMRPAAVIATAILSCAAFLIGLLFTPVIPRLELPALVLTDCAIGIAVITFSILLDRRDRLIFLLNLKEQIQARRLAAQNTGLRTMVDIDALTGVANRRSFDEHLAAAWRAAGLAGAPIALIMIDIDNFKLFNDHYGHQGGDDCLRRVARAAQSEMRAGDLMARYGGEEFAVIAPGASLPAALGLAERLRRAVANLALPHEGAAPGATVTISLGAASMTPAGADTSATLIAIADRNLYAAKRAGRNRVGGADTETPVALS